jgi:hypothetical protein
MRTGIHPVIQMRDRFSLKNALDVFRSFFRRILSCLQLPFGLMIELPVPAVGLSGLLPEFAGASDKLAFWWACPLWAFKTIKHGSFRDWKGQG